MSATSPILVLTGSPGSGKTTAAHCYAKADPRGLHLTTDDFFLWPAHPIEPTRPESKAQNEIIVRAFCRAAAAFHEGGYRVVVDGIVGPWMLPLVADEFEASGVEFAYAVLQVDLETAIERGTGRAETPAPRPVIEQMHASLADLGPFERHAVDVHGRTPEAIGAWLREHLLELRPNADAIDGHR